MRTWFTFYRTLAFPLIGITAICAYQVWAAHSVYFVFRVFWVKVLTTVVIGTFIYLFRSEQFVFYNNLGYSRTRLFILAFLFDFLIWIVFMVATANLI
jgi:hypothetical protein